MPDVRDYPCPGDADEVLIEALRALPAVRPAQDGWPQLAAALRARARSRRTRTATRLVWPLAAAAVLVLALVVPRSTQSPTPASQQSSDTPARSSPMADVDRLIAQSQWLERLVAADAIAPVAQDGDQLLLEQGLRDRIRQIDSALVASAADVQPALWQARIGTLAQLAEVRWAGRQAAWSGDRGNAALSEPVVRWSN